MGGPIAQLLWQRHRDRVEGLVLCATSRNFRGHPRDRLDVRDAAARDPGASASRARRRSGATASGWSATGSAARRSRSGPSRNCAATTVDAIIAAAAEIGRFSSHDWVGDIDVPTSVIVHTRDQLVPARRQWKLAHSIPGAEVYVVDGDHFVVASEPAKFVPVLLDATAVRRRAGACFTGGMNSPNPRERWYGCLRRRTQT